jgi:hypothetical protein
MEEHRLRIAHKGTLRYEIRCSCKWKLLLTTTSPGQYGLAHLQTVAPELVDPFMLKEKTPCNKCKQERITDDLNTGYCLDCA